MSDRKAARIAWLLPAITITLSSLIHAISGNARAIPFFISESDHPGLERIIFTSGLSISGILLIYVSWRLYQTQKENGRWYWVHLAGLCGAWVGGNLFLMAFFDMYDHIELHIITALNVFHFGLIWAVLAHLGMRDAHPTGKKLRYASISLAFISFGVMTWSMGKAALENPDSLRQVATMSEVQHWIDYAAPAEYLLVIGFILTLASFESELTSPLLEEE